MRYVIASDIHGDASSLHDLLIRESRADAFLLLGDTCLPKEEINPFVSVLGNCDLAFRGDYPLRREIVFPSGHKALLAHHPLPLSSMGELASRGYQYFFHGHTHEREEREVAGVKILCPGSLSFPRDGALGSYIVAKADEKGEEILFLKL